MKPLKTMSACFIMAALLAAPVLAEGPGNARSGRLKAADTNGDGQITFEEFSAALPKAPRELFDKRDQNKDGVLGKADMAQLANRAPKHAKHRFADVIAKADADGNQQVTFEELGAVAPKLTKERFGRLDTDGDGVLTPADRPRGDKRPERGALLGKADADGNGKVTFEELKAVVPTITEEKFAKIDTNSDGVLTQEDRPSHGKRPDKQALLQKADADKNGEVTFEELKAVVPEMTQDKFNHFDQNGDGVLTPADRPRGGRRPDKHAMLQKADVDKNGEVTFEELKTVAPKMTQEKFDQFDQNGDGVLSPADHPGDGEHSEKRALLMKADADNNGEVTFEELKAVAPKMTQDKFDDFDRNGDGVLSREDAPPKL